MADLTLYTSIETGENPKTICSITTIKDSYILANPTKIDGLVEIHNILEKNKTIKIQAHESELDNIMLNSDGSLIATASIRGTLIRISEELISGNSSETNVSLSV